MFLQKSNYANAIDELVDSSETLYIAVAFWGADSVKILKKRKGKKTKIICNLLHGGTNPEAIEEIMKILNNAEATQVEIKMHNSLHAKILFNSQSAIIGSANLSSNGLAFTGVELKGWEEAGYLIQSQDQSIKKWFDAIWRAAEKIEQFHLDKAKAMWSKKRNERLLINPDTTESEQASTSNQPYTNTEKLFSFKTVNKLDLKDRKIYFIIARGYLSAEAEKQLDKINKKQEENLKYSAYENFDSLKELEIGSILIDCYFGIRGKIRYDRIYKLGDTNTRKGIVLTLVTPMDIIEGLDMRVDANQLTSELGKLIPYLYQTEYWKTRFEQGSGYISAYELYEIWEQMEKLGQN